MPPKLGGDARHGSRFAIPGLFQSCSIGLLLACTRLGQRGVAALRGRLEFGRATRAHRIRKRGKARGEITDQARIEAVIEGEALGRFLDLDDERA